MPFAVGLRRSLHARDRQLQSEFWRGDSLEEILGRDLLAVEDMAAGELITSILLLSEDGRRLTHGAAPSLPQSYREAIDGLEIGPSAGSCGTAAFTGQPVYVTDIAMDPLWDEYREIALAHGLRSCWSTPIRDPNGRLIATFAIYHRTAGSPTPGELEAIEMITAHVAQAILWAREAEILERRNGTPMGAPLKLISDNAITGDVPTDPFERLLQKAAKLELLAAQLEQQASDTDSVDSRAGVESLAECSRSLADAIRKQIESFERATRWQ